MKRIENVIGEFLRALNVAQISFDLTSFNNTLIPSQIGLPQQLIEIYLHMCPKNLEIPTIGNNIRFFGIQELEIAQQGYLNDSNTGWSKDWLVILDEGGYPVFLDTANRVNLNVYTGSRAREGKNLVWRIKPLAPDIMMFIEGLTIYIQSYSDIILRTNNKSSKIQVFTDEFYRRMKVIGLESFTQNWLAWLGYI